MVSIVLFKNNLRLNDNDVLFEACKYNDKILPIYILDEFNTDKPLGASSKYWLHHSLKSLNNQLNNKLQFYPEVVLMKIFQQEYQFYLFLTLFQNNIQNH